MSREEVLETLRREQGGVVSGQELSRRLGLSRAAVWKAVDGLRRDGYVIEARSGSGYRLIAVPDAVTEPEIRSFLGETAVVGREIRCFAELSFQSPRGKGVYLSVLLRPALPLEWVPPVTAMAGVAVCRTVERVCGMRPGLKWPNDPVLNGKKLCGILTELSLEAETGRVQSLVLGIGINVLQEPEDFSPEVQEVATSLLQVTGTAVSRPRVAAALLEELDQMYADLRTGRLEPYRAAYRQDCVNLGKQVQLIPSGGGQRETAEAVDINDAFELIVRREDGTLRTVRSGEVSVRGLWGYTE